ncbi:sensor histidine kinase [Nocardioides sp. SYSU DS0663]|uniref:sensor histidine kinase n=1 Tax=Nocardioides sp. SYSU DS0663 TaxID=3416445 RepID=UPI003F4C45C3
MTALLTPVVVRIGVLVVLTAAVAIAGTLGSTRAVNHLLEELNPAAVANRSVLQDLTDADVAVSAYARSGEVATVDGYRQALQRVPGHGQPLRELARGDAELERLVARQEEAAAAWIARYAAPRVAAPGGPGTFQPGRFLRGQRLFAEVREAHRATDASLDGHERGARAEARWWLRGTITAIALLALVGWLMTHHARRRVLQELAAPLGSLEAVVHRMARGEHDARAGGRGPREVRAVAAALNELADQQERARAVEVRIHDELRALDTAKDDFVSNISHELRTPLTTISGYLELVAEEFDGQMAPRHERILEATRRNVSRLKVLIDDLLTLSRAENRATALEQADLTQIVQDAATDVRITAARRGIRVEVEAPRDPLYVLADRAMLSRAFLNLLSNAVKFSHDGGVVGVALTRDLQRVEVAVVDHGIGIPAAEVDRLGTRFFRASNAVHHEIAGTGLGVRIVQTIVHKHDGDMVIESEEGAGTTVTVGLRLQGDPGGETAAPPVPGVADASGISG